MKAFNLVATKNSSGTKTFISNLLLQINSADFKDTVIVFISKSYLKLAHEKYNKKVIYKVKPDYLNNFILRLIWMQLILPIELKLLGATVLFSSSNYSPYLLKLINIKSVLFVHTVMPWEYLSLLPGNKLKNRLIKLFMESSISSSQRIIVPSSYAKNKLIEKVGKNEKNISIVYLGVDHIENEKNFKLKIENFNYDQKYILSIISCVKYHNIINLLKAFKLFLKNSFKDVKYVLVLKIIDKNYFFEIKQYIKNNSLEDKIIIFSDLKNEYLYNLYKYSKLYLFSSYSEVFGFTTLEAMTLNIPILTSDTSALREINREFSIYFDPDNIQDIKEKLTKFCSSKIQGNELLNRQKHLKNFLWKNNFEEIIKIIYE